MTGRGVWSMWGVACVAVVVGSWGLVGCGGSADRSSLKGYSKPLRAIERAELVLGRLEAQLSDSSDAGVRGTALSAARAALVVSLPYSMKAKVSDAAIREQLAPKVELLLVAFEERVSQAIEASPSDLPTARAGVAECQALVGEMAGLLGR